MPWGAIKLDKADREFSKWIRTRDEWTCQRCFKKFTPPTASLHCSHFQSRGKENTRFNPLNADAMCIHCHQYFTANPGEHYQWQVKRKGQSTVDNLILLSNLYHKRDRQAEYLYWSRKLKEDFGEPSA